MIAKHLIFNEKLPFGFDMLDIDQYDAKTQRNLTSPRRAAFYCIIWFKEGAPVHTIDYTQIEVKANTFLFIRQDAVQFFDQKNKYSSQLILFTDTFFAKNQTELQFLKNSPIFNNTLIQAIPALDDLQHIWRSMVNEFNDSDKKYKPKLLRNYLHNFLLTAERAVFTGNDSFDNRSVEQNHLASFREHLESHFRQCHSVAFYAQKLFITPKSLNNATQKLTGKTAKQITDERIILEAKRELLYSKESGKIIAFSLGFDEPTNFFKFFKKQTGHTPASFRLFYLG
ncbi:AraC family transcriptional regulator [Pedobacter sp. L105]|uniref:helix-turn-helix domain-containing protein n=1 Tax=Pedobacter sp. L105 TaxID=1641871 RepID=UPI00131AF935|nr:helix-turn-helix domain-containing protein [Pedobacter sp. L105]